MGLEQGHPRLHGFGGVDKRDHRALDHIVERPVGQDAHRVPLSVRGLHADLLGHQRVQHGLHVRHQTVVADQVGDDVAHWPSHVAGDQVDDRAGGGREAQDAQLMVHKHGADAGAGEQVVHVAIGTRQVRHLGLQLGIDGAQFLVDRLQFFLGGLQFLVGGLQFLVDRLHFLIRRFEFFVGALQFLLGALEIFVLGAQLVHQRDHARVRLGAGVRQGGRGAARRRDALRHRFGCRAWRVLEDHQVQVRFRQCARAGRHRAHGEIDTREVAVGLDLQTRATHDLVGAGRLVQGRGQIATQAFAGHLQDVADAGLAVGGFQVHAGASVQVQDVALAVDQRAVRGQLAQQGLFGQVAQGQFLRRCRRLGAARLHRIDRRHRRQIARRRDAPDAVKIRLAPVQLGFPVLDGKHLDKFAHAFGSAEEQPAARFQRVVEQGHELFLKVGTQIDQQVAATDQVKLGERRVLEHILLGKHQHVADALVNAVGTAVGLGGEKARQAFRREVGGDAGRIQSGAGSGDRPAVDVGGEHLHRVVLLDGLHMLLQQDRNGIGFLAGGAAGRPDAHRGAGRLVVKELWNHLFLQHLEGLRIAEEIGHADQHVAKQRLHLTRRLLQVLDVAVDLVDLVHRHAPLDAAVDRAWLVLREVVAGLGAQQDENFLQRALDPGRRDGGGLTGQAEGVRGVGDQLGRHFGRRQCVVHQAGGDGAARHAFELGGFRVLRHHHAALALDRAHALRAVAAGAGQHDADGTLALVLCERAKEKVDRQALAARGGRFQQLQRAVQERHVAVGRDDVGAVGCYRHAVLDLEHLHAGIAADQVGEDALVVGGQVLDQHKGHAGFGVDRHAGEERLKGRQAAGRGTDADNRKRTRRGRGRRSLRRCVRRGCVRRGCGGSGRTPGFAACFSGAHAVSPALEERNQPIMLPLVRRTQRSGAGGRRQYERGMPRMCSPI